MKWIFCALLIVFATIDVTVNGQEIVEIFPHDGEPLPENTGTTLSLNNTSDDQLIRIVLSRRRRAIGYDANRMIVVAPTNGRPKNEMKELMILPRPLRNTIDDDIRYQKVLNDYRLHRYALNTTAGKEYFGQISLGSPPQTFIVNIDTGSLQFWVHSARCNPLDQACRDHRRYDSRRSSTYRSNGNRFEMKYGRGSASGFYSTDTLQMGSLRVTQQMFAEVLTTTEFDRVKWDGIMGLGFSSPKDKIVSPLTNFQRAGLISERRFSLRLRMDGGELTIGGVNEEQFTGKMHFFSVTGGPHWQIRIDAVSVETAKFQLCNGGCDAILNSGTSLIAGPRKEIHRLHMEVFNATKVESHDRYFLHCPDVRNLPPVAFLMLDKNRHYAKYFLRPWHYVTRIKNRRGDVCVTEFMPIDDTVWIFGDTFLRRYLSYYNVDKAEVGLARARNTVN